MKTLNRIGLCTFRDISQIHQVGIAIRNTVRHQLTRPGCVKKLLISAKNSVTSIVLQDDDENTICNLRFTKRVLPLRPDPTYDCNDLRHFEFMLKNENYLYKKLAVLTYPLADKTEMQEKNSAVKTLKTVINKLTGISENEIFVTKFEEAIAKIEEELKKRRIYIFWAVPYNDYGCNVSTELGDNELTTNIDDYYIVYDDGVICQLLL
jgi:hypothetical protein